MEEAERIAGELRLAFDGDTWTGRSIGSIVRGFSAGAAARRPANGGNSAWQLLRHIGCWIEVARIRFEGTAHSPRAEDDMPVVTETSDEAWAAAWAEVEMRYRALAAAIERAPDSRLNEIVPGKPYTHYHLLHGVIQHSLYHAGQMALLARGA